MRVALDVKTQDQINILLAMAIPFLKELTLFSLELY